MVTHDAEDTRARSGAPKPAATTPSPRVDRRRSRRLAIGIALGCLATVAGCGDDTLPLGVVSETGGMSDSGMTTTTSTSTTDATGSTTTSTTTTTDPTATGSTGDTDSTGTSDGSSGSSTGQVITNCGDLQCSDHGSCVYDVNGLASCVCDNGYVADQTGACVVDETCIRLRFLEDGCRQVINGAPAVGLFYGVDFCAGTAVTPAKFAELGLSFQVLENGIDIATNVESEATIVDTGVENYVMIVLDVSGSVSTSQDVLALTNELRDLVTSLTPGNGDPPVHVSLTIFGRFVRELEPFTADLAIIDATLADIGANPATYTALVGSNGTQLFTATKEGIENTQRIRDLRAAVTNDGVLTTGTVVIVTDGIDTSNGELDSALVSGTSNSVISIGISDDIDDTQLAEIGRDGSFLAPTTADWATAFAEITTRVEEYPLRSYLLAYCSSATTGSPSVEVTVQGATLTDVTSAECAFNADAFSSNPLDVCDANLFATDCDTKDCGGITACGACSDDACCAGTACIAPQNGNDVGADCTDQDDICFSDDQVCDPATTLCTDPAAPGDPCDPACDLGTTWCMTDLVGDPVSCEATLALGATCDLPEQCASLNCNFVNPNNPLEGRVCQPAARIYDHCGDADAICEAGSFCEGANCSPRKRTLQACGAGNECRTSQCIDNTVATVCGGPAACFFSWDAKVVPP